MPGAFGMGLGFPFTTSVEASSPSLRWYAGITTMDGFAGLYLGDTLNSVFPDGGQVSSWYPEVGARVPFQSAGLRPTMVKDFLGVGTGNSAICFSGTNWMSLGSTILHNNSYGLTVFGLILPMDVPAANILIGQWQAANSDRAWNVGGRYTTVASANGVGTQAIGDTDISSVNWWTRFLFTWLPNQASRFYRDGVLYGIGAAVSSLFWDSGRDVVIGAQHGGFDCFRGYLAAWGWLTRGISSGHADLVTVDSTLASHYGLA